jgi:putative DNA primase/helicase
LADLWDSDPIEYAKRKRESAGRLDVSEAIVEEAVKRIRAERKEQEQSQATRLMAIGFGEGVKLWHSLDGQGHASVLVDGHWEHYRIRSNAFDSWLRGEYGRINRVKVGARWVPQVPGTQAVRDAVASLDGYAQRQGEPQKVSMRVSGDEEVIWIDLGRRDWSGVKVTKDGWQVVREMYVAFVRSGTMLPLPIPRRGGDIRELGRVLNVRKEDFVLVAAWLLQVLNPVGDYPFINVHGEAEVGKTFMCNIILRTVDPRTTELRKPRRVEDLLIAARNNWTIGFDNFSCMSWEFSDTLCMIATGISSGARTLYTDDEEHTFTVRRPVIFNGIPGDLTERSDLASRTIKLEIPRIVQRRTKSDLEREFEKIWPGVLGALLDGLVGGLRDQASVKVDDPARLMDFEQFAEAGCRAMGFEELEFVEAYKANRHGSMVVAAEASAVGRAVVAFIKDHPEGFRGQMQHLYGRLSHYDYKGDTSWRDWPRSPTRLSTELSRLSKPLAALSIRCLTKVDRRQEGGTQKDVVIEYVFKFKKKVEEQPQVKAKEVGKVVKRPSWRRI